MSATLLRLTTIAIAVWAMPLIEGIKHYSGLPAAWSAALVILGFAASCCLHGYSASQ